jgi:hypothetical protein
VRLVREALAARWERALVGHVVSSHGQATILAPYMVMGIHPNKHEQPNSPAA